ncbi:putative amidohydrolase [Desulfitispora alkaliphila]
MHLFDINIPGGITFYESKVLGAGDKVTIVDTPFGKMGVVICYDLRFPELFRLMLEEGAEFVVIPAAFNTTTGPAHWETLLKARAIDNQVYVIASSPARNDNASYHAYGHSAVFNPWGDKLIEADEKEKVLEVEVDFNKLKEVRRNMPLLQHRRLDAYNKIGEKEKN